ncbi:site-specific recombinase, phage integrase family [Porphyromonas gingivalis TDC60]|nr:site-specific recombinase, phage integrase family [Porphyromonas gingivalis TDC60]
MYYIDRCKARQDGYTVILCRITVDGASTVMTTGEECTPEEWNVKQETFARRLAYILFVNSLYNRELFCIFEY